MNITTNNSLDDLKAFQLLSEVADDRPVSQRELAKRMGIALGLVNSYLKNFVTKGYIRIKNYPHNRYAYLLTPSGMAEKARLAYQHVNYFTSLYTVTRQDYSVLFNELTHRGVKQVVFCGVDEVAEIAWLSLLEAGLELQAVMDDGGFVTEFMGHTVMTMARGCQVGGHPWIVVTSLKRATQLRKQLLELGVRDEKIQMPGNRLSDESLRIAPDKHGEISR